MIIGALFRKSFLLRSNRLLSHRSSVKCLKIAGSISGNSFVNQHALNKKTEQALRRWAEQDQNELWRDQDKTTKAMKRLEVQMMLEPEIAQVCDDQASTIRRLDIAHALSNFFYSYKNAPSFKLLNEVQKWVGAFELCRIESHGGEVRLQASVVSVNPRIFWKVSSCPQGPFLIFHEFAIRHPNEGGKIFCRRQCGFVFIGRGETLIKFVVSQESPKERRIETYRPIDMKNRRLFSNGTFLDTDRSFHQDFSYAEPFANYDWDIIPNFHHSMRPYEMEKIVVLRKPAPETAKFIEQGFAGSIWDIPL